jgi:two-component system sensor kinase FixL
MLLLALLVGGLAAVLWIASFRRRLFAKSVEIEEINRRFQATFEQAAVGVAHVNLEGRWIRINARFCELTGYPHDELMTMTVDDITHPLDREWDNAARDALLSGEIEKSVAEKRYLRKDGEIIWVNATRSTIRDAEGRPEFFVAVVEEITARKEAEARLITGEAQYRAIFDSAVEAIAVIDAQGMIQSVNQSVERTFGYTHAELMGSNIKMLMPRTISTQHDGYLRKYRETGEKAIIGTGREVIGRRKNGSQFPLDLSVAEWERGGETFFTGIMRDISARKDAEAALHKSEEKLRGLQNEFAHLARVNDLGEMAAAIAHEINQPLTAIVNFLNTGLFIAEGTEAPSEAEARETTHLIRQAFEQALRAGEIVRRLREFIGQSTAVRRPEPAERLIDSAIALALIDARSNGIDIRRLSDAGDALVEVDSVQIQQVLANLMRNAVDAMLGSLSKDTTPALTISTAVTNDGMVEFAVTDTGPGLSSEIAERLFDPFVTTKSNGMGMGLSVCRRLIEAHGGTIEADSVPGKGACFSFKLPLYKPVLH